MVTTVNKKMPQRAKRAGAPKAAKATSAAKAPQSRARKAPRALKAPKGQLVQPPPLPQPPQPMAHTPGLTCACPGCVALRNVLNERERMQMLLLDRAFAGGALMILRCQNKRVDGDDVLVLGVESPQGGFMPLARLFSGSATEEVVCPEEMIDMTRVARGAQA